MTAALVHDPAVHKLGRKPRVPTLASHLKRAQFAALLKTLSPAPASISAPAFMANAGIMRNGDLGDCTAAAKGHLIQLWTGLNGNEVTVTDEEVVAFYSGSTGYDGTPATDQGGNMDVVAEYLKTVGLAGHKIVDDRALPKTLEALKQGIYRYGAVDGGWDLPTNAQSQDVWALDPTAGADGDPGSWGGHDAVLVGYDDATKTFEIETWGQIKRATYAWALCYLDEALAYLSNDWAPVGGAAPNGLTFAELSTELDQVAEAA